MSGPAPGGSSTRADLVCAALAALATSLPFARGTLAGASFYFRDLSLQFFPVRRFVAEGLRAGELRAWNPYAFEGAPLSPQPLAYPLDLLHVLRPHESFFTLLLALHVPLAAIACYALARQLGARPRGACAAGIIFGLGGFALSTVNLYVYAQALPWVALFVLALLRAAAGGRREVAAAALAGALLLSTTAIEFAVQALVIAVVLLLPLKLRAICRVLAASALAGALAAFAVAPVWAAVGGSARGAGFATDVVLAHSVHPLALLQVLAGGLFGDPSQLAERWWGQNFFPRGFPYILSLYLGATTLALAAAGLCRLEHPRLRLLLLACLGVLVCLGPWAGWGPLVDLLGPLRKVRFPVKAFLSVHLALALLAAFGVDAIAEGRRRALRVFVISAGVAGALLAAGPHLLFSVPAASHPLLGRFFPPDMGWDARATYAAAITADAAAGGWVSVAAAVLAALSWRGGLRPALAASCVLALVAADLLRHGAGLNPMAPSSLLAPSREVAELAARLRRAAQRVLPLDSSYSPAYYAGRQARGRDHERWSFAVVQDTLSPDTNLRSRVPTALTPDRTMLVPTERVLAPELAGPDAIGRLLPRAREAGVSHVLALDPLDHPSLVLEQQLAPPRIAPLTVRVYRLADTRPLVELRPAPAGAMAQGAALAPAGVQLTVESPTAVTLVLRQAMAPGWSGWIDQAPAPLLTVDGRYIGVNVPAGRHRLVLRYQPPGLALGASVSLAALALVLWLGARGGARARRLR